MFTAVTRRGSAPRPDAPMPLDTAATPIVVFTLIGAILGLVGAARFFTGAAEQVGLAFGMSPFAVGVFIIAVGTSLPELVAAVLAVSRGSSEIVSGNVLGANTANLLLILGVISATSRRGIRLGEQRITIDLNFMLGSAMVLTVCMFDGTVGRLEALALLCCYLAYVGYLLTEGRSVIAEVPDQGAEAPPLSRRVQPRAWMTLLAAGAAIYVSGDFTLDGLMTLAARVGISPAIASLTILSLGTTLPELVVSLTAVHAGRSEMAVGNILGSCIFNAFGVVGVGALVGPLTVPPELLRLPLPAFVGSALLFYQLTSDKRVSRWEGMLFVILYLLLLAELAGLA
jgi:cation:H+ antiporter